MNFINFSYLTKVGILCVVYVATAKFGLSFDAVSGFATLVWPPTGIALAFVLLFGYRLWPGIFVAAFLVNLITGAPFLAALGMEVGNTLEPLLGAYLMRRFTGFKDTFINLRQMLGFIFLASLLSPLVSATFGTSSLYFNGVIDISAYPKTWIAWWLGDVLGVLIITPLIIYWSKWRNVYFSITGAIEGFAMLFFLFMLSLIIFGEILGEPFIHPPLVFLLFLPLIWSAIRFGFRMTTFCIFSLSVISIVATMSGYGPFARASLFESFIFLQIFMAAVSTTTLIMTVIVDNLKQVKKELTLFNEELEDKIKERANALVKSKEEQLQHEIQLEEKERDFVSMASHQLMSPLALVRGYTTMLVSGKYNNLQKSKREFLDEILKASDRMSRLIKSLLTVARIESGIIHVDKTVFNLDEVVKTACRDLRFKAEKKRLRLTCNSKVIFNVRADPYYTQEVLSNLIDNAIKYTDKGSITITTQKTNHNFVRIIIKDSGRGIEEDAIPHVFDKFYISKNWVTTQSESTRLGLYISRLLVEGMGGTIGVESKAGDGSTFYFTLPIHKKTL